MESDDDAQEMRLLQDQSADEYVALMDLLSRHHVAAFKSLVRRGLAKQPPTIDVNHRLGHPHNASFLDKAVRENLAEVVEFLLELGADPNRVNEELRRAPLHLAAEEGRAEALAALLRDPNVKPNLEVESFTALHYAVKANSPECVRLLLQAKASPNVPNSRGVTAIHLAADQNNRDIVQLIIDQSPVLDVDTYKNYRKETARMAINRRFSDIEVPASSGVRDYASQLRYFLTTNDQQAFEAALEEMSSPEELENGAELLRMSVKLDRRDALGLLMKRSGLVERADLLELAKIAVEYAHPEVLRKLLARRPDMANALLLPASQELGVPAKLGPNNRNNRLECLNLLLAQSNVDVRQVDDKGNTPLHYATRSECREAIDLLLRKGSYLGYTNAFGSPPLEHMPAGVLEAHLDECLQSANERTEEFEIIMDYQNLVPHDTSCNDVEYLLKGGGSARRGERDPCSETEALLYIAESRNLKHLLKHPLLASFLYLKFLRIRHVLYINFFLYLVYFVMLNFYIWLITTEAAESSEPNVKPLSNGASNETEGGMNMNNWSNHPLSSVLLTVSLMYLVVRELLQFLSSPLHYLSSPINWFELALVGVTAGLLLGAGRAVSVVAILLSSWELVMLLSQHPRFSTNIEMLKTVTVNFAKFLLLYLFVILAFAYAFYVLFKTDDKFQNPAGSLFKTIIMLTGEFDSSDLAFGVYPIMSRLVFVGFIFLIVIILLNLLNGLAVNDTGEILAEAELVGLVARARLVAYAERIAVGSPFTPRLQLCCCLGPMPCRSLTTAPVRFLAKRLQLFPRYLPHATLSVKPLKSYEITLHGRSRKASGSRCSRLRMDARVAQRAKRILAERALESPQERIQAQLADLQKKYDGIEAMLREIKAAVGNNNADNAEEI